MKVHSPVIIIGMSRSGTSMIARMLDDLGLFVGKKLTPNHEAVFFREINDWLLTQCSGGLEDPGTIKYLLQDNEARGLFEEFVRFAMKTPHSISFLGLGKYLSCRTPERLDVPWGWKDPRNTFTLPIWLDMFPDAKVIHIYRHPLDIVSSLMTRRKRGLSRLNERHSSFRPIYWYYLMHKFILKNRVFVDIRGGSLEEGFTLWEEYLKEARSHVERLGDRAIEIKYEDFLERPSELLKSLSEFCELKAQDNEIENVSEQANKSRAYAYLNDPRLKAYSIEIADRLDAYGY
ncbi:MAG: sulfotransferase [Thermodesulfobacteriota bacterium]